jgi:hypothetical protein
LPDSKRGSSRRWTVIAAALLIAALGLIVMYTNPRAFFSPIAVVVVAAIGLAALLLEVRFRRGGLAKVVHVPLWLNSLGILLALFAMFGDRFRLSASLIELIALGAVGCFGISGFVLLSAIRKQRVLPK